VNIAVCAKVAPESTAQIKVKADGTGVDRTGIKSAVSPYDDFAIEEAIALKEKGKAGKVHICTIGDTEAINILKKEGLAKGGDDLTVSSDPALMQGDSLLVAQGLAAMIRGLSDVQLVFCGKQAIDDDNVQVPAMLAELLGWPQVCFVSAFSLDGTTFKATRNIGGGVQEVITGQLPVVITTDKGLNTPRFPKLPDIMKANAKPIHKKTAADLGLAGQTSAVVNSNFGPPAARPKGRLIAGDATAQVKELVRLLRDEAKVL
jgi:electron transfer flavoprotein beta subunit